MNKFLYPILIGGCFGFSSFAHAETLASLITPPPTGSGTIVEIQYLTKQYSELISIG